MVSIRATLLSFFCAVATTTGFSNYAFVKQPSPTGNTVERRNTRMGPLAMYDFPTTIVTYIETPSVTLEDTVVPVSIFLFAFYISVQEDFQEFREALAALNPDSVKYSNPTESESETIPIESESVATDEETPAPVTQMPAIPKPQPKPRPVEPSFNPRPTVAKTEGLFLKTELSKQEKLDLLAKAEYYDQEAMRYKKSEPGKKRSVLGRVLKPWKK